MKLQIYINVEAKTDGPLKFQKAALFYTKEDALSFLLTQVQNYEKAEKLSKELDK